MKAKNRDQSLSDSRELDGSYDQLTGECREENLNTSGCLGFLPTGLIEDGKIQWAERIRRKSPCVELQLAFKKIKIKIKSLSSRRGGKKHSG